MPIYEFTYIATNPIIIFVIYRLFHVFLGEKVKNRKTEIISYVIYFVLLSIIIFITRIPVILLVFNLLSFVLISLNYKASFYKKIIVSSLMYSSLLVVEIIVSMTMGFLNISIYKNSSFNSVLGIILIRSISMILAYLISKYSYSKKKSYDLPKIYYLAFSIILFGTLYLFISSLEKNNLSVYNVLINGFILLIVNITMIIIDERIYNSIIINNEKNILKQQNRAYENQIEIINQSNENVRAMKHDIKNHIIMLNELYKSGNKKEIEDYTQKILDNIESDSISKSNNFIIDSIINFKLAVLKDTDTKINLDINVSQNIHILAYDLTIILGNLLDNAVTAILKSKEKKLDLIMSCNMGNLIILMDNSFNGDLIIENNKFKTTKLFKYGHGMGFNNISKVLENYGGEIRIEHTNNTFSVAVIIPYEDYKQE